MAWFKKWWRRDSPPTPPSAATDEANAELALAQEHLIRSELQSEQAGRIAKNLEKINKQNHFAEKALLALKGVIHE